MDNKQIQYTNQLLLILIMMALILDPIIVVWFGWNFSISLVLLVTFGFVIFLALNKAGFTILTRILFTLYLPVVLVALSVISKMNYPDRVEDFEYYEFRYLLIVSPLIPLTIFSFKERIYLYFGLLFIFVSILIYDPIHNWFGVGIYQLGLGTDNYAFTDIVVIVAFLLFVGSMMFVKRTNESLEETIIEQTLVLENRNTDLESELEEKNQSLVSMNKELISHNNELQQFSYTISHNLRGPVSSLMGLIELMNKGVGYEEEISKHIETSVNNLNAVITDLNKILEIRGSISQVKEKVFFRDKLNEVKKLLAPQIRESNVTIEEDFSEVPYAYSVGAFLSSIIYNLILNSIKYRSPDRSAHIKIQTRKAESCYILSVKDNGLGIDTDKYEEDLFKMYKRFHVHTEGKGLGLYLVKVQTELLGGEIFVSSQLNDGAEFNLKFDYPEENKLEYILERDYAFIFYDALTNSAGVKWKNSITSDQYKYICLECLELVKRNKAPNWISDLTHKNELSKEDINWMINYIVPEAISNGVKRIIIVAPQERSQKTNIYLEKINHQYSNKGLTFKFFEELDLALEWLIQFNK